MSTTNQERVGRALKLLASGLRPFVERELKATYGERWRYEVVGSLRDHHLSENGEELLLDDVQPLLLIMWDQWNQVFKKTLGHSDRNYVSELRTTRNSWAHQNVFSSDDADRALDTIQRLLQSVAANDQAEEVSRLRNELRRIVYDEQARSVVRRNTGALPSGQSARGMLPWREVVTPHPDVARGVYELAEFAADLSQVYRGEGSNEYRDPRQFFQRTYLTHGLRDLLLGALKRLSGNGGDPIVELQTNFGGGKTHSLLALFHLFSGVPVSELIGLEPLLKEAGLNGPPQAKRAVLVGFARSPADVDSKGDGCEVHTLWGEMAWQLLGAEGYRIVEQADLHGVNPGSDLLQKLFLAAGPSLILIDEWVVFVRQLYTVSDLPAGSFEANLSFIQSLTEAAKAVPHTLVVATIPESDTEKGGEGGREAAGRMEDIFRRVESPWRPAGKDEGFEIVRRRLFEPITDPTLYAARDAVARTFVEFYRGQKQEFPNECSEADYERRIKACYPIHPELFERLFSDWSAIEKFQRTRGVLRLMATVIHELWIAQDQSPMILPASMPLDASRVQSVLTDYLADNWVPVIEKDVDGAQSLPRKLDSDNANFGRFLATKRVARTIFFGSAPTLKSSNKGIPDNLIKLGCALPGENIATFGDALRRLADQATYLYQNEHRYWYDTNPSVARLAQDRAAQYDDEDVYLEIHKYLEKERAKKGDFASVHVCPDGPSMVTDEDPSARLVILKPQFAHGRKDTNSAAWTEARKILDYRSNAPRTNRNALVFLVADRARVEDLKQAARLLLAWRSINDEHETLNLDAFQSKQARDKYVDADKRVKVLIPEIYTWLLAPEQVNPQNKSAETFAEYKLPTGGREMEEGMLASRASSWLKTEEALITQFSGTRLRMELDRIPLWRGEHVSVKELFEDFARYVYLPRLKNQDVLRRAIEDGVQAAMWERDTFAYADGWDAARGIYLNLRVRQAVNVVADGMSLLVKPEAALRQIEADERALEEQIRQQQEVLERSRQPVEGANNVDPRVNETGTVMEPPPGTETGSERESNGARPAPVVASKPKAQRFYASVPLNALRANREFGDIITEVVQHLVSVEGAEVRLTLEIEAHLPDGASESLKRTVKENGHVLHFQNCEFEDA